MGVRAEGDWLLAAEVRATAHHFVGHAIVRRATVDARPLRDAVASERIRLASVGRAMGDENGNAAAGALLLGCPIRAARGDPAEDIAPLASEVVREASSVAEAERIHVPRIDAVASPRSASIASKKSRSFVPVKSHEEPSESG